MYTITLYNFYDFDYEYEYSKDSKHDKLFENFKNPLKIEHF